MKDKYGVKESFEKLWGDIEKPSFVGLLLLKSAEKIAISIIKRYCENDSKVVDVGCGTGRTLKMLRDNGFCNSIGTDNSEKSIKICNMNGFTTKKDVFLSDVTDNDFKNNNFCMVFSEGLLEHFDDINPVVTGLCRISSKHVLVIQPNHFSTVRFLEKIYYRIFHRLHVDELTYTQNEFNRAFALNKFKLKEAHNTFLNFFWVLLYEKETK
jgi:SAM-dependent methyltransferase